MTKVIVHIAKAAVAIITALLFFSCGLEASFKKVDGSGNVITQNRPAGQDFKSVSAGGGLEVIIEQGSQRSITVEADDNLQQHIKTEIKDGVLEITSDVNIRNAGAKKVIVRMTDIEGIESSSGASVKSKNTLKGDSIDLTASSGSSMEVTVETKTATCESGSGSSLTVNGSTEKLESQSSSGSSLNAKGLIAKKVIAEASSGSTSIVNPTESLSADASSGGSINYVKTPNSLDKKSASGGSVSQQ